MGAGKWQAPCRQETSPSRIGRWVDRPADPGRPLRYWQETVRWWTISISALPPAAKGGVMHTLLTGEIGGGQSTAIIGRQKLSALGGIGAGRAASRGNTVLSHGRVFTTATGQRLGGLSFTAYDCFGAAAKD